MKTILALLLFPLLLTAQTTYEEVYNASIQKAVSLYPDSAVEGSPLFKAIQSSVASLEKSNPDFLKDPKYPLILAKHEADKLGIDPIQPSPSSSPSSRPSVDDLAAGFSPEDRSAIRYPGLYDRARWKTSAATMVEAMMAAGYSKEECDSWLSAFSDLYLVQAGKKQPEPPPQEEKKMTLEEELAAYKVRTQRSPIQPGENMDAYRLRLRLEDLVEAGYGRSREARQIAQQLEDYAASRAQDDQNWRDDQLQQQTELLKQIRANQ